MDREEGENFTTARGALVHFTEEMYTENVTTSTPWIALISCEVTQERNESTIEGTLSWHVNVWEAIRTEASVFLHQKVT